VDRKSAFGPAFAAHYFVRWRTDYSAAAGISWLPFHFLHAEDSVMNITLSLAPMMSRLAGVLILIVPRLLSYIVAAYLIVIGLLELFGGFHLR
jgi:hypothetical protein